MPSARSFPNELLTRAYLRRGVSLWLATRLLASTVIAMSGLDPLRLSTIASIHVVLLTAAIAWVDMHRRKERAFLGNLGVSGALVAAICAVPSAVAESIMALVVRA